MTKLPDSAVRYWTKVLAERSFDSEQDARNEVFRICERDAEESWRTPVGANTIPKHREFSNAMPLHRDGDQWKVGLQEYLSNATSDFSDGTNGEPSTSGSHPGDGDTAVGLMDYKYLERLKRRRKRLPESIESPGAEQNFRVKVGKTYWFEYHCEESHSSADADVWYHSHQQAKVLRMTQTGAGKGEAERGQAGEAAHYQIRFSDGFETEAGEDELLESREQFLRPDPPRMEAADTYEDRLKRRREKLKALMLRRDPDHIESEPVEEAEDYPAPGLPPNLVRWFAGSKVVDDRGYPLVVFHSTPEKFRNFDTSKEGAHFGTYDQASNLRKPGKKEPRGYLLSIKNPLRMEDKGVWNHFNSLHAELHRLDLITDEQAERIWEAWNTSDDSGWETLKQCLLENGYDGVVYSNDVEGPGDSYIAFWAEQIRPVPATMQENEEEDQELIKDVEYEPETFLFIDGLDGGGNRLSDAVYSNGKLKHKNDPNSLIKVVGLAAEEPNYYVRRFKRFKAFEKYVKDNGPCYVIVYYNRNGALCTEYYTAKVAPMGESQDSEDDKEDALDAKEVSSQYSVERVPESFSAEHYNISKPMYHRPSHTKRVGQVWLNALRTEEDDPSLAPPLRQLYNEFPWSASVSGVVATTSHRTSEEAIQWVIEADSGQVFADRQTPEYVKRMKEIFAANNM